MLQYLSSIQCWIGHEELGFGSPVPEVSWQVLRDSLHTDLFLRYRPQEIAITIIYFVCGCYGVKIPYNEHAKIDWWKVKKAGVGRYLGLHLIY